MAKGVKDKSRNKEEKVFVRMTMEQHRAIEEAAEKSGWNVSEQIRFELFQPRGMWKQEGYRPYKVVQESQAKSTT